jgi:hypothetical protein
MEDAHTENERIEMLLVKALDGELTEQEQVEFNRAIKGSLSIKHEYEAMKKIKEITREMSFSTPADAVWDNYWTSVYNRIERGMGWIASSIGAVIILTYCAFKCIESLFLDPHLSLFLKAGIILTAAGISALVVSVVREKYHIFKKDPYKEIKR